MSKDKVEMMMGIYNRFSVSRSRFGRICVLNGIQSIENGMSLDDIEKMIYNDAFEFGIVDSVARDLALMVRNIASEHKKIIDSII